MSNAAARGDQGAVNEKPRTVAARGFDFKRARRDSNSQPFDP